MIDIRNFPAADLARKTGDVLDAASRAPVAITKHRKPRFVLMSMERYEELTRRPDSRETYTLEETPDDVKAMLIAALERDLADTVDPDE